MDGVVRTCACSRVSCKGPACVYVCVCVIIFVSIYTCQVMTAFVPVEELQPAEGEAGRIQTALSQRKRHRSWLTRERGSAGHKDAWRPRKRFRVAAEKWVVAIDRQLRVSTGFGGLKFLKPDWQSPAWSQKRWRSWPHMGVILDQGGDGLSGLHAMLWMMLLNVTGWFDWAHGIQNDIWTGFKAVGHFSTCLLFLLIFNLSQGPEKEEGLRFQQLQECLEHMIQIYGDSPETFELLNSFAPNILTEMAQELDFQPGTVPLLSLWEHICSHAPFTKKAYRVKMCEFGAWVAAGEGFLSQWSLTLFKVSYCTLELDMLHGKGVAQKIFIDKEHIKEATHDSTSTSHVQIDSKILKSTCQNLLVVAVALLSESNYRRLLAIMVLTCSPMRHWQQHALKVMKSASENKKWLIGQMNGGFMLLVTDIGDSLKNYKLLQEAGFFVWEHLSPEEQQAAAAFDDDYARMHGTLVLCLMAARVIRNFMVTNGWPHQMVKLQLGNRAAKITMQLFKQDHEVYKALSTGPPGDPVLVTLLKRSVFLLTSVQMWVAACTETNYEVVGDMVKLSASTVGGILSTVAVEDTNNVQKNNKQCKGSMKFRRPERSMAVSIASKLLEKRHRYTPVQATNQVSSKGLTVTSEDFGKKVTQRPTVSVAGIATYQQKAAYFSPVAMGVGGPAADCALFREVHQFPALKAKVGQSYMGAFAEAGKSFAFKRQSKVGTTFGWHVGCGHFPKSGFAALPVALKNVPGHTAWYFDFTRGLDAPPVFAVFDWQGIEGLMFTWRSWAWQCLNFPNARTKLEPATRMVVTSKAEPLIKVAAKMAFWSFDQTMVKNVCAVEKQMAFPSSGSLLEVLVHAVMAVLAICEDEALTILRQRVIKHKHQDAAATSVLAGVDEAAHVLDPKDEDLIKSEQEKMVKQEENHKEFETEWKQNRQRTRAPTAKAKSKAKASAKSSAPPPTLPAQVEMMDQKDLKQYMPPKGLLWKNRSAGSWNSKVEPWGGCSRAISAHGENEALRQCIASAWKDHCLNEGIRKEDCPMHGLPEISDD